MKTADLVVFGETFKVSPHLIAEIVSLNTRSWQEDVSARPQFFLLLKRTSIVIHFQRILDLKEKNWEEFRILEC